MGSTPTARLDRVRYSTLNRRVHSRRLRGFLDRVLADLSETGAQVTADHTTDAGTKAELQITFGDLPDVGDTIVITIDGTDTTFYFTDDVGADAEADQIDVLIAVDVEGTSQNLAYAVLQDTDHQSAWANNASAGIPAEIEYSLIEGADLYLRAVEPGVAGNEYEAVSSTLNVSLSDTTFAGGIEPDCVVTGSAHGLATGDGPFSLAGSSGGWTALDFDNRLYYVVVVDSTHFRLSSSKADAGKNIYHALYRPSTHIDDVIKYRRAAESVTALFEQLRAGMTSEQLAIATDIDPA